MNKSLEKALRDQKIRRQSKRIAESSRDSKMLHEQGGMYKAFVEPFTDVFDALKITTKEILSNAMMIAGQILTISPKKQKERMRRYEERQSKIAAEWKPLMDRTDAALSTGDADIVALAFSPGLYAVSSLGATAYNAAEGVGSFLDTVGLKKGLFALLPGVDSSSVSSEAKPSKDDESSLLDKLNLLFLGTAIGAPIAKDIRDRMKKESSSHESDLIRENKSGNFKKDFAKYLQDTGLDREFEKMQDSLVEYYSDIVKGIDDIFDPRKEFVERVSEVQDMEELLDELKKLKQKDEDASSEVQKIERAYEESKEKLVNSEDFIQTAKEEFNKEDITKEEIESLADKSLYADFMKEVRENFQESLEKTKEELSKELEEALPPKETLDMIKQTKAGLKLFNVIRDAKSKYNIS